MRTKPKREAILRHRIMETHLVVYAMGDPDIRACINQDPDYVLLVCDGKEDTLIEDDKTNEGKELYVINKYENNKYIIYLHLKRRRPVKLCVYEFVNKENK